jgi:hypothetical protein
LLITKQVLIPQPNNLTTPSVARKFPKLELACERHSALRALELLTEQSENSRDEGGGGCARLSSALITSETRTLH